MRITSPPYGPMEVGMLQERATSRVGQPVRVRGQAFRRPQPIDSSPFPEAKPAKAEKSWEIRSLISKEGRKDTRSALLLAAMATVPEGGLMAVAMADDAGKFSPFMKTVQAALLPYAYSTSFLVGLPLAAVVLPAAALVAGIGETIGRLPVPKLVSAS